MPNLAHILEKSVKISCDQIQKFIFLKHPSSNNFNGQKSLSIKVLCHFRDYLDSQGIILK